MRCSSINESSFLLWKTFILRSSDVLINRVVGHVSRKLFSIYLVEDFTINSPFCKRLSIFNGS